MYLLDFYDIVFFIKALKQPPAHFSIFHYVSFSTTNTMSTNLFMSTATITIPEISTPIDYQNYGTNYHS